MWQPVKTVIRKVLFGKRSKKGGNSTSHQEWFTSAFQPMSKHQFTELSLSQRQDFAHTAISKLATVGNAHKSTNKKLK